MREVEDENGGDGVGKNARAQRSKGAKKLMKGSEAESEREEAIVRMGLVVLRKCEFVVTAR